MTRMNGLRGSEKGQALPLALIALGLGALLVGAFLSYTSTNLITSRVLGQAAEGQHAADAGIEDAIWNLMYGGLATSVLTTPGDSTSYSLDETVNGLTPTVTVTRNGQTVATAANDGFESGGWSGGSGWVDDWLPEGNASIVRSAWLPHEGEYCLRLRGSTDYAKRAVDTVGKPNVHLRFWALAISLEGSDEARCLVSPDGSNWDVVQTWEDGDDDYYYHGYDIDLSAYEASGEFWVAFEADMSSTHDYLYVDAVSVVTTLPSAGLPSDGFEAGWSGGAGWLGDWHHQGSTEITADSVARDGRYHLEMRDSDSYVKRAADLSAETGLHLQFWSKARSLEQYDEVQCLVSPDGSEWTVVRTWTQSDSDSDYHFNDIDLSPYQMSDEFWIAFNSDLSSKHDYFYVDDLRIVRAEVYHIASAVTGETIEATVVIEDSELSILSWQLG